MTDILPAAWETGFHDGAETWHEHGWRQARHTPPPPCHISCLHRAHHPTPLPFPQPRHFSHLLLKERRKKKSKTLCQHTCFLGTCTHPILKKKKAKTLTPLTSWHLAPPSPDDVIPATSYFHFQPTYMPCVKGQQWQENHPAVWKRRRTQGCCASCGGWTAREEEGGFQLCLQPDSLTLSTISCENFSLTSCHLCLSSPLATHHTQ